MALEGSEYDLVHLRELAVAPDKPGLFQKVRPVTVAKAATADELRLQGYELGESGGMLNLRLFWDSGRGAQRDWTKYIHLLDGSGQLVAQFDGPPLDGLVATSLWHENALYVDARQIELPQDLAAGEYQFRVGLYSFESGERLPFLPESADDRNFSQGQLVVPYTREAATGPADQCDICKGDQQ